MYRFSAKSLSNAVADISISKVFQIPPRTAAVPKDPTVPTLSPPFKSKIPPRLKPAEPEPSVYQLVEAAKAKIPERKDATAVVSAIRREIPIPLFTPTYGAKIQKRGPPVPKAAVPAPEAAVPETRAVKSEHGAPVEAPSLQFNKKALLALTEKQHERALRNFHNRSLRPWRFIKP